MPTITLLAGIPASGKSSYAQANFNGNEILPYDGMASFFGECDNVQNEHVQELMCQIAEARARCGGSTVIDYTNLASQERHVWRLLARQLRIPVNLVVMDTPFWLCLYRNAARSTPIPLYTMEACSSHMQAFLQQLEPECALYDDVHIEKSTDPTMKAPTTCSNCGTALSYIKSEASKYGYIHACTKCCLFYPLTKREETFGMIYGGK